MKKYSLISLMLALNSLLFSQVDFRSPSLINSGINMGSSNAERVTDNSILDIYNRLVKARGNNRLQVPHLEIRSSKQYAAAVDYSKPAIVIEEVAIQACRPFGDAAVAFLLGHELTHYYENHSLNKELINQSPGLANTQIRGASFSQLEREADYLGGFLVYSAGFGFFHRADELLAEIYRAYGLPDSVLNYPTLSERKENIRNAVNRVEELVDILEMANLLTIAEYFEEAGEFYLYVSRTYQSRELYNNIGVALVLEVVYDIPEVLLNFKLPFQIDLRKYTGIGFTPRDPSFHPSLRISHLQEAKLQRALSYFDEAISMDKDYAPAYLNKACVYAILRDFTRARFIANVEAREKAGANAKILTDIEVLLAIADVFDNNYDSARYRLEAATAKGSRLAEINLKILHKEDLPISNNKPTFEEIDHQSIFQVREKAKDYSGKTQLIGQYRFYHNPNHGNSSMLMMCENKNTGHIILFHLTHRNYSGTTLKGISIGSPEMNVIDRYGFPVRTHETPTGRILRYGSFFFIIDSHGRVERWGNYAVMMN